MLIAKSKARKQNLGLTIPVATRQARKHVDAIMPGVLATVESKDSFDLDTNTALVVTTVTFPRDHIARMDLQVALSRPLDGRRIESFPDRIVITRKR